MPESTTPSEIWNDIFKDNVGKDDPLWKEYLDKAAVFDVRMVDEWNKIVDVLLVFVALFISVVTSVIIQTLPPQFPPGPNPANITNDLLVAIYNHLVAQSNNTTISPVDTSSYFKQSMDSGPPPPPPPPPGNLNQNAILYSSLSLSIIVSVIALMAKLWVLNYSRQAFSVGSPYDRAMKRQEAYNGVLVWNLGGVINMLPVMLLISLFLFEIYVSMSIQKIPIFAVEALLNGGMMFLGFTSLGGAFIRGCPFRSAFSDVIRLIFENLQTLLKRIDITSRGGRFSSIRFRCLWIGTLTLLGVAADAAIAYATIHSNTWFSLFFFPAAIPIAYSAQKEAVHKPQKYKISSLALWVVIFVALSMGSACYISSLCVTVSPIFPSSIGVLGFIFACWMFSKMSKYMAATGEIDAIAWLLVTEPPQHPATFFKKAGQMTGLDSIGHHYRPRLLESLMPLLTLLITSCSYNHAPEDTYSSSSKPRRKFKIEVKEEQFEDVSDSRYGLPTRTSLSIVDSDDMGSTDEDLHLKNIEIYTACLARLSEFTDYEGNFWCLREDAMQHPKLEQSLIDKLVVFANPQHHFQIGLRSAATKVLNNYELDLDGKPVTSSTTVLWIRRVANALKSTVTLILNIIGLTRNSQDSKQGHPNLHRQVDPVADTRVESAHSFGDIELEEAKRDIGGSGMC